MPSLGTKKDFAKRDMNFFADFTAAAAKMTGFLGYGVVVGIVVVAAIVGIVVYGIIRNAIVQAAINELNNQLQSEEYAGLEARAAELQQDLNDKNNYYYALSQMRQIVDKSGDVSLDITDVLKDSIPSDSYIENYTLSKTSLNFNGYSFSYYSVLNLVNMLNNSDVFAAPVNCSIHRVDGSTVGKKEDFINNGLNIYYAFEISGALTQDVYVSVSRYASTEGNALVSLGATETQSYRVGDTYSITDIATYTQTGIVYNLTGVDLGSSAMTAEQVASVVAANEITGVVNNSIDIKLYYTAAQPAQAEQQPAAQ